MAESESTDTDFFPEAESESEEVNKDSQSDINWLRKAAERKYGEDIMSLSDKDIIILMEEDVILRGQSYLMLQDHKPFCKGDAVCSELMRLISIFESIATDIPEKLTYDKLKRKDIPAVHRARLGEIWQIIPQFQRNWEKTGLLLKTKWDENRIPNPQKEALDFVDGVGGVIQKLRKRIAAIISIPQRETDDGLMSELGEWQEDEKNARIALRDRAKNYYLAQILFYTMLLEEPFSDDGQEGLIVEDELLRAQIKLRVNILSVIDVYHQTLSVAKAAHYLSAKRLRKIGGIPFVFHPWEVCLRMFNETALLMLENGEDVKKIIIRVILALLHDVEEDTMLHLNSILDFCRNRANKCDSRIYSVISSGFGRTQEEIKNEYLNHINDDDVIALQSLLRVSNKRTVLDGDEVALILKQNIFGKKKVCELLGVDSKKVYRDMEVVEDGLFELGNDETDTDEKILTSYRMFPETYEKKWDMFLLRMYALLDNNELIDIVIQNKLLDCDHNISTLTLPEDAVLPNPGRYQRRAFSVVEQLKKLRGSMRLISFVLFDYGIKDEYTQNCLKRLLNTVIKEFERVMLKHPESIESVDREYLCNFKEWRENSLSIAPEGNFKEHKKRMAKHKTGKK